MKNPRFVVGLAVLLAVLLGGGGLFLWTKNTPAAQKPIAEQPVSITCAGGSEKTELMADPEVKKLLREKFGLTVTFVPMGSFK